MINRLRVILPPESKLIAVILFFAIAEGPFAFIEWKIQQPLDFPRPGLFILRFIAFIYGFWRISSFHPAYQAEYRSWLERSPWTYKAALPAGPIWLVWEDLLPLGGLAVMGAFLGPLAPYQALGMFLFGYLTALASVAFRTGTKGFGYLVLIGLGLGLRAWQEPKVMLGMLGVFYLIGILGLRFALKQFPWSVSRDSTRPGSTPDAQENQCGWPFDQLRPPIEPDTSLSKIDGLMTGLLVGWFFFAAESLFSDRAIQVALVQKTFPIAIGGLAVSRLFQYTAGYAPPISLMGRIRTFRWIIPGYDKIFLAPLLTILVGVLALDGFRPPGLDDLVVLPIALAVAVTVSIDTGPSYLSWRLTGQHRIAASPAKLNAEFVKVG
jgi:hypothetical protein